MLSKRLYIPIGILIIAICAVGLLSLRSDVPKEPVVTYKVVTPVKRSVTQVTQMDTTTGNTADETVESKKKRRPEKEKRAEAKAERRKAKHLNSTFIEKNDAYKAQEAERLALEAERLALEAESEELLTWSKEFQDRFFTDAGEVLFAADLSESEFLEKYPTVEDRINIALELLKFEDYREEVVKRFEEEASPKLRQTIYKELENAGYLEEYKRIFLQPSSIPEYVAEFIQANLDEETKTGRLSQ
jgi:hypothetical protein